MNPTAGRDQFATGTWLFLRGLALVHLIAFVSLWVQVDGLIGPHGILPAGPLLAAVHQQLGAAAYWQLPTVCWWIGTGAALHVLCGIGVVAALALFAGIAPAPMLGVLWLAYLSLCGVGQVFFNFQWDALLIEATFLAVWIAPWSLLPLWSRPRPPRLARWLIVWLLFRLMFLSGAVKLSSGDPNWAHLTALSFHFETQPLPTPLAWSAHQLPPWLLRASCALMFVIELGLPWLFFVRWRRARHAAALATIAFMLLIALTGNYTFFNLLTIILCLPLLDDAFWRRPPASTVRSLRFAPQPILRPLTILLVVFSTLQALPSIFRRIHLPSAFYALADGIAPFRSVNNYGLFMVMTTSRPEIIIEGSRDGRTWLPYEFPDKPGDPARRPPWVAPHQPRLDWQMWFAALGDLQDNRWMIALCDQLLRGNPTVSALFARNPFPGQPPRYIRAVLYDYHFTTRTERARTGRWWRRTPIDFYLPPVSLPAP
jgi:hypothetical protein